MDNREHKYHQIVVPLQLVPMCCTAMSHLRVPCQNHKSQVQTSFIITAFKILSISNIVQVHVF